MGAVGALGFACPAGKLSYAVRKLNQSHPVHALAAYPTSFTDPKGMSADKVDLSTLTARAVVACTREPPLSVEISKVDLCRCSETWDAEDAADLLSVIRWLNMTSKLVVYLKLFQVGANEIWNERLTAFQRRKDFNEKD